jgi:hypothetical protein
MSDQLVTAGLELWKGPYGAAKRVESRGTWGGGLTLYYGK